MVAGSWGSTCGPGGLFGCFPVERPTNLKTRVVLIGVWPFWLLSAGRRQVARSWRKSEQVSRKLAQSARNYSYADLNHDIDRERKGGRPVNIGAKFIAEKKEREIWLDRLFDPMLIPICDHSSSGNFSCLTARGPGTFWGAPQNVPNPYS